MTDIIKFGWELDTMVSCFHEHISWYTFYTSRHTAAHPRQECGDVQTNQLTYNQLEDQESKNKTTEVQNNV